MVDTSSKILVKLLFSIGAEQIQVIGSEYGQTKSDWDKKIDLEIGLIYDAVPSRFPLMLSGLFIKLERYRVQPCYFIIDLNFMMNAKNQFSTGTW